jgi:peptidoglycan/LPS O-acetylase OafA/YrhL
MRRLPTPLAFALAALAGAVVVIAAEYLYDHATSKGNDLAVALISFHAAGTFAFVTVFTLLWSRRGKVSWRCPITAFSACLALLVYDTVLNWRYYDEYYAPFFWAAWLAVAVCGGVALVLSRRIQLRTARGRENSL